MRSAQIHLEAARIEVRELPDSEGKFASIEELPGIIEDAQATILEIAKFREDFERRDTRQFNNSSYLMELQSLERKFLRTEKRATENEEKALSLLQQVRAPRDD